VKLISEGFPILGRTVTRRVQEQITKHDLSVKGRFNPRDFIVERGSANRSVIEAQSRSSPA
jgi:hypothetical protein